MSNLADPQFLLRLIVLGLFVATAILCLIALVKRPERWIWAIVPLSLAIHAVAFYAAVLLDVPFSTAAFNRWSTSVRIHEGVLVFAGVWLFVWPARSRE